MTHIRDNYLNNGILVGRAKVYVVMDSSHPLREVRNIRHKTTVRPVVRPRAKAMTRAEFISKFCEVGGYSESDLIYFLMAVESLDDILVTVGSSSLSVKICVEGMYVTLLTFKLDKSSARLIMDISSMNGELILSGRFPSEASDFVSFVRKFSDSSYRCDRMTVYANVQKVLESADAFVAALRDLAYHLRAFT